MQTTCEVSQYVLDMLRGGAGSPLVLLPSSEVLGRVLGLALEGNTTTVDIDLAASERAELDYVAWRVPRHVKPKRGIRWATVFAWRSWRWSFWQWRRERSWRFTEA